MLNGEMEPVTEEDCEILSKQSCQCKGIVSNSNSGYPPDNSNGPGCIQYISTGGTQEKDACLKATMCIKMFPEIPMPTCDDPNGCPYPEYRPLNYKAPECAKWDCVDDFYQQSIIANRTVTRSQTE